MKSVTLEFRKWVYGDADNDQVDEKLSLMRALSSEDSADHELLQMVRYHVVGALVDYAMGNPCIKTVKPLVPYHSQKGG